MSCCLLSLLCVHNLCARGLLKSICVEFDLHKVVITLSLIFTEIQSYIPLDSLLKSASIYNLLYAVYIYRAGKLQLCIFYVEVPGILVHHIKHK